MPEVLGQSASTLPRPTRSSSPAARRPWISCSTTWTPPATASIRCGHRSARAGPPWCSRPCQTARTGAEAGAWPGTGRSLAAGQCGRLGVRSAQGDTRDRVASLRRPRRSSDLYLGRRGTGQDREKGAVVAVHQHRTSARPGRPAHGSDWRNAITIRTRVTVQGVSPSPPAAPSSRSSSSAGSATRQMKTRNCAAAWEAAPAAPGRPACCCEKHAQGAAAPKQEPGSAAVVEGHLVAVGVRERESAAERPLDWR